MTSPLYFRIWERCCTIGLREVGYYIQHRQEPIDRHLLSPPDLGLSQLRELLQGTFQRTPKPEMLSKQVSAAPDCLVSHQRKTLESMNRRAGHNPPNSTAAHSSKIQISEITQKEFREAYKRGETTGVIKFSQKEKQIYLRMINISTELAIRNKEERTSRTKIHEDSLATLVPQEYHDLLSAFEKGEKTSLSPSRPGINLEINMVEGKRLPDENNPSAGTRGTRDSTRIHQNQPRQWMDSRSFHW